MFLQILTNNEHRRAGINVKITLPAFKYVMDFERSLVTCLNEWQYIVQTVNKVIAYIQKDNVSLVIFVQLRRLEALKEKVLPYTSAPFLLRSFF